MSARRGLFVLFEDLAGSVISSQVLVHVRDMRERGSVDFEVWAFVWSPEARRRSEHRRKEFERLSGGPVRVFPALRPAVPGSAWWNSRTLRRELRSSVMPSIVHARTDYSTVVCGLAREKERPFLLVWDCRGDAAAEHAFLHPGPEGRVGAWVNRLRQRRAGRASDRAVFVSEALRDRLNVAGLPAEIVPCTASSRLFQFDDGLREDTRAKLGYAPGHRVFVYAGSLVLYQCFRESIDLIASLRSRDPDVRFLILTPDPEQARPALSLLPQGSTSVLACRLEEVNAYLNAADFGLLLRRNDPLNEVASPTKFAEYALTGLPVLMTRAVRQACDLGRELGLATLVTLGQPVDPPTPLSPAERAEASRRAAGVLSREAYAEVWVRVYGAKRP